MIKILIVEDSRVAQEFLAHVFNSDPAVRVVGIVSNGAEALQTVKEHHPDVITMDMHMPKMDGVKATRLIMEQQPTPIVILSASTHVEEMGSTFQAMEAGAVAVVLSPPGIGHPDHKAAVQQMLQTVKLMSEIKVVQRIGRTARVSPPSLPLKPALPATRDFQLVAMGASTGGPPVLHKILSPLSKNFSLPLLIVQHIASGFTEGFVDWLAGASGFPVQIATHGLQPLPGHGYVAPDGFHIGVASGPRIVLSNHAPEGGLRPSVAYLFHTVAQALGPRSVGVLLTGMGRDGAEQLLEMKAKGALTIAQDKASSIVHGMPGEAIKLGATSYILPPEAIAVMLTKIVNKDNGAPR